VSVVFGRCKSHLADQAALTRILLDLNFENLYILLTDNHA